jgi:hypothetical protein
MSESIAPVVSPRELTFGEKAVGLTFNPSNDPRVQEVKEAFARAIDLCNDFRNVGGTDKPIDANRMASIAITEAQTAQMWAVKALTWKE